MNTTTCTCGGNIRWDAQQSGVLMGTCERCTITLSPEEWTAYMSDTSVQAKYTTSLAHIRQVTTERNARMTSPVQYAVFKLERNGEITREAVNYLTMCAEQELRIAHKGFEHDGYTVKGMITQLSEAEAQKYAAVK